MPCHVHLLLRHRPFQGELNVNTTPSRYAPGVSSSQSLVAWSHDTRGELFQNSGLMVTVPSNRAAAPVGQVRRSGCEVHRSGFRCERFDILFCDRRTNRQRAVGGTRASVKSGPASRLSVHESTHGGRRELIMIENADRVAKALTFATCWFKRFPSHFRNSTAASDRSHFVIALPLSPGSHSRSWNQDNGKFLLP